MAEIICIIGNKGGTGKTSLSHMLNQGLGLLGQRSVCVLTDTEREPLDPAGRRYLIADARTQQALGKVVDKIRTLKGWVGVIDGGGNRSEMDRQLYSLANLVLLPFRDSHEDIRTVIKDLEAFPRAWAVPSQWPTNPWQQAAAEKTVREQLGSFSDRLIKPVFALSASKLLLQKTLPATLPTPLANACRALAHQVLDIMEISYEEPAEGRAEEGVEECADGGTTSPPTTETRSLEEIEHAGHTPSRATRH